MIASAWPRAYDRPEMAHVVFYDGVCGFCSRVTQFILARDHQDHFRFAQLQSAFASETLRPRGHDPADLDTMFVLSESGQLYSKAHAALFIGRQLGGWLGVVSRVLGVLPSALLNWGYDRVAHSRYHLFGKSDVCLLPSEAERRKFIG